MFLIGIIDHHAQSNDSNLLVKQKAVRCCPGQLLPDAHGGNCLQLVLVFMV